MNGTPRLRSAWPPTPQSQEKTKIHNGTPTGLRARTPALPAAKTETTPTIPFSLLDAPSQRFYVSLFYVGMTLWRLYDYSTLSSDRTDGFWLFTKWVGIDTAFLYSLSGLNIPWLQWSSSTFTVLFSGHALANWMLMFQIPVGDPSGQPRVYADRVMGTFLGVGRPAHQGNVRPRICSLREICQTSIYTPQFIGHPGQADHPHSPRGVGSKSPDTNLGR